MCILVSLHVIDIPGGCLLSFVSRAVYIGVVYDFRVLSVYFFVVFFFFSSRRRHTRYIGDWSSDVCSSDLEIEADLVLRSVRDIGGIRCPSLRWRHFLLHVHDRETEESVDPAHPRGVPDRKSVV